MNTAVSCDPSLKRSLRLKRAERCRYGTRDLASIERAKIDHAIAINAQELNASGR